MTAPTDTPLTDNWDALVAEMKMANNEQEPTFTDDAIRAATRAVIDMLIERHDAATADYWVWECTPMPIGLPSPKQLGHGLLMAFSGPVAAPSEVPADAEPAT